MSSASTGVGWGTWIRPTHSPPPRWGHSAVLHAGEMLVFGGADGSEATNDILSFNLDLPAAHLHAIIPADLNAPAPRLFHSAVLFQSMMVIFGGWHPASSSALSDLHAWDCNTRSWSGPMDTIGPAPSPRWGHSAVCYGDRMVVFGGCNGTDMFSDLYLLDLSQSPSVWVGITHNTGLSPGPTAGHTACLCGDAMLVFGGSESMFPPGRTFREAPEGAPAKVFALDLASNTMPWTVVQTGTAEGPTSRMGHCAVQLAATMIIHGGCIPSSTPSSTLCQASPQCVSDAWLLDFSDKPAIWKRLPTQGEPPSGRQYHSAVLHAPLGSLFILGGTSCDVVPVATFMPLKRITVKIHAMRALHCLHLKALLPLDAPTSPMDAAFARAAGSIRRVQQQRRLHGGRIPAAFTPLTQYLPQYTSSCLNLISDFQEAFGLLRSVVALEQILERLQLDIQWHVDLAPVDAVLCLDRDRFDERERDQQKDGDRERERDMDADGEGGGDMERQRAQEDEEVDQTPEKDCVKGQGGVSDGADTVRSPGDQGETDSTMGRRMDSNWGCKGVNKKGHGMEMEGDGDAGAGTEQQGPEGKGNKLEGANGDSNKDGAEHAEEQAIDSSCTNHAPSAENNYQDMDNDKDRHLVQDHRRPAHDRGHGHGTAAGMAAGMSVPQVTETDMVGNEEETVDADHSGGRRRDSGQQRGSLSMEFTRNLSSHPGAEGGPEGSPRGSVGINELLHSLLYAPDTPGSDDQSCSSDATERSAVLSPEQRQTLSRLIAARDRVREQYISACKAVLAFVQAKGLGKAVDEIRDRYLPALQTVWRLLPDTTDTDAEADGESWDFLMRQYVGTGMFDKLSDAFAMGSREAHDLVSSFMLEEARVAFELSEKTDSSIQNLQKGVEGFVELLTRHVEDDALSIDALIQLVEDAAISEQLWLSQQCQRADRWSVKIKGIVHTLLTAIWGVEHGARNALAQVPCHRAGAVNQLNA